MRSRTPLPARGQGQVRPFLEAAVLFAALCIFARSAALGLAAAIAAPLPMAETLLWLGRQAAGETASSVQEQAEPESSQEPVRTETRDIFEVFLDSVCLDDNLLTYLIDILKRRSEPEFAKLSHAAARTELKLDDFLAWLGNMELLASEDEQACAAIMDKCLYRLEQEGELELIAALLAGDEKTFKLFRTQAPELLHLPDATYEWYCKHYLDRYYPVRFILHHQGIEFPRA